jgi:hypothetical protein
VQAVLDELPGLHTRLSSIDAIQAEQVTRTAERLAEIDQHLAEDGLAVSGSKRQLRPHPLLPFEAALRRELLQGLRELEARSRKHAQPEELQALMAELDLQGASRDSGRTPLPAARGRPWPMRTSSL